MLHVRAHPVDRSVDEWFEQLRRAAGDAQVAEPDVDTAERSGRKAGRGRDGWQRFNEDADTAAAVHEAERAIDLLDRRDHRQQHFIRPPSDGVLDVAGRPPRTMGVDAAGHASRRGVADPAQVRRKWGATLANPFGKKRRPVARSETPVRSR